MAAKKSATTAPLTGREVGPLSPTQFQGQFDDWLRRTEKDKPNGKLRELADRITKGGLKLRAAEVKGVSPDDEAYKAAVAKLQGLKDEVAALRRSYSMPAFAMHSIYNFLRASRGWGMPEGSRIEFVMPGVFSMGVDLSEDEAIPF